jgi:hypothetical protein
MLTLQKVKIDHAERITETQDVHVITFYTLFQDTLSSSDYSIVTWRLKAGRVESQTSIARQWPGKQVSAATDTQATIEKLLETMFRVRSLQNGLKKSSLENRQSSSGVPSEQLVDSLALQGRLRRWRYELSWQSGCEEKTLRVLLCNSVRLLQFLC